MSSALTESSTLRREVALLLIGSDCVARTVKFTLDQFQ
jgi:hypothetical protein